MKFTPNHRRMPAHGFKVDGFVKSQKAAFRSWFDTCLRRGFGRQASPRTENQALRITSKRSP
jgi:hypothetical protein